MREELSEDDFLNLLTLSNHLIGVFISAGSQSPPGAARTQSSPEEFRSP